MQPDTQAIEATTLGVAMVCGEASQEAAPSQSIIDLIGIINQTEETLAMSRNTLLRRANTEPLTAPVASALALMALTGEEHARTARRRYRRLFVSQLSKPACMNSPVNG